MPTGKLWNPPSIGVAAAAALLLITTALGLLRQVPNPATRRESVVPPNVQVSEAGAILYRVAGTGLSESLAELVWLDRQGRATQVDLAWRFDAGPSNRGVALSPDGTRAAVRVLTDGNYDIWVKELPRGPLSRLTFDEAPERKPQWLPDGESVMFLSTRNGDYDVWARRADGTGTAELLVDTESFIAFATASRDGEWLVLRTGGTAAVEGGRRILVYRPGVDSVPAPLLAGAFDQWAPAISPDGRWIAYASAETGTVETFVRPFPDADRQRVQISTRGGWAPVWSNSGRELFYFNADREMVAARLETMPTLRVVEREVMFELGEEFLVFAGGGHYAVTPDDQRFLMMRQVSADGDADGEAPS